MVFRFLAAIALLLPFPALAQGGEAALEGTWSLEIGGATIFVFSLDKRDDEWRGTWTRPSRFASDGNNFAQVRLPLRRLASMAGFAIDGGVEISFPDPRPNAIPDIFRFTLIDSDAAELLYVGTGLAPYTLQRVPAGTALGPFSDGATYSRPAEAVAEPGANTAAAPTPPPAANAEDFRLAPSARPRR